MKTSVLCFYLFFCVNFLVAQHWGVYKTELDFIQNQIFPDGGASKLQSNTVFNNTIIAYKNGVKYCFKKDSIFGYNNKSGSFRCNHLDKQDYQIMENGKVVIYMIMEPTYGYKNFVLKPQYYFSENLSSSILPLNIINIKRAFPENERLHHYLDIEFYQKEISMYNSTYNTYQINYLINKYK
jgi:hypothetical protein